MLPVFERVPGSAESSWHFNVRRAASFEFDWHYHAECELTLIVEGSGQRFVGDSVQRYEPGDLVLIGSNVPHTWRSEQPGQQAAVTCQFRMDFLGAEFFQTPEFASTKRMLQRSTTGLVFDSQANDERERLRRMAEFSEPARTLELLALLAALSKLRPGTLSTRSRLADESAVGRARIEVVVAYVDREYRNALTLAGAAALAGTTARSLSRFFQDRTSRTFTDYVNDVRCAAASRLLIETELSVGRIAFECGYGNLSNFNRRFHERFLLTPSAYRRSFLSHC